MLNQLGRLLILAALGLVSWRAHAEVQSFGVIGDAGLWNDGAHTVRDSILTGHVQNLILPGDNLYDNRKTYQETWSPWFSTGLRPYAVAIGNHTKSYAEEMAFFRMPGEYYTFAQGDVRWIVLNSDNDQTADAQAAFYDGVMAKATEPIIFLTYHHPSFDVSHFHPWQERPHFQAAMRPRLVRDKDRLAALVVGHDHLAALIGLNDLPMILSGAVQEQRKPEPLPPYQDGPVKVQVLWMYQANPHWARLDADTASHQVWLNYVDAKTGNVDCSVRIVPRPMLPRDNCARTTKR